MDTVQSGTVSIESPGLGPSVYTKQAMFIYYLAKIQ